MGETGAKWGSGTKIYFKQIFALSSLEVEEKCFKQSYKMSEMSLVRSSLSTRFEMTVLIISTGNISFEIKSKCSIKIFIFMIYV